MVTMRNQDKRIAALAKNLEQLGYERRETYWYADGLCTGFSRTLKLGEPPKRDRYEFWQPKWQFAKSGGSKCWFVIDVTVDLGDDVFSLNLTAYLRPKVQGVFQTDQSFGPRPHFSLGSFSEDFLPSLKQAERQLRSAISFLAKKKA